MFINLLLLSISISFVLSSVAYPIIPSSYETAIQIQFLVANTTLLEYTAQIFRDITLNKSYVKVDKPQGTELAQGFYCDFSLGNSFTYTFSTKTCKQSCLKWRTCKGGGTCGCVVFDFFGYLYSAQVDSFWCINNTRGTSYTWQDGTKSSYYRYCFDENDVPVSIDAYTPKEGRTLVTFESWNPTNADPNVFEPPTPCDCPVVMKRKISNKDFDTGFSFAIFGGFQQKLK